MRHMIGQLTPALRKVLHNTAWLMVDRIVRMGLGLLVSVWIARYLGLTQYGILSFAISFVALFGTMSTLGLDSIVVRHLVTGGADSNEILGTAFVLRLLGGMLAPLLAIGSIHFMEPNDPITVLLVNVLSVGLIFQAFDTIDVYFQAQVQSKVTVWAKNAAFLAASGIRVFLVYAKAPLWTFAVAQVTELALGALALTAMYRWRGGRVSIWRARRSRAIQLLQQSWPVILTGMAIMVYLRIDMVMLKFMQGDAAVGLYATATRISEVWYFIPVAIVSSVSPAIIRAKDNPIIYYERIGKLFSLMSLIALVIGSGVALSSHWIIHTLYTEAFRGAAPVLAVHVWASLFVFLGVAQGPWDVSQNLLKLGFYRTLAGAVVNVLLNLVLIPKYSAMGAAIATVISYATAGVLANAFDSRTRPIFVLQLRSVFPWQVFTAHNSLK
ncbi:MAG: flippase [Steroidobacteraceae bacterium]|jgi:polysaccharide transporter, PST family